MKKYLLLIFTISTLSCFGNPNGGIFQFSIHQKKRSIVQYGSLSEFCVDNRDAILISGLGFATAGYLTDPSQMNQNYNSNTPFLLQQPRSSVFIFGVTLSAVGLFSYIFRK